MNFGFFKLNTAKLGCFGIILGLTISGILGAFCWPYTLNTWLAFFGKTTVIIWQQGFLLGCVPIIGRWSLPAAATTWILMLFLA